MYVCVFVFELARPLTNLFCDSDRQLHTAVMSLGKSHFNMLTRGTVPGLVGRPRIRNNLVADL